MIQACPIILVVSLVVLPPHLGAAAPETTPRPVEMAAAFSAQQDTLDSRKFPDRTESMDKPTKARASFLAGAGLVILTLLVLGTALALVRAFKR